MGRFETTRWSVVLRARGEPAEARAALETLCRTYRPPVLAFIRSRGYPQHVADDLTQAFFARLLERGWHARADSRRGRFRSFLLIMLKRFLIDARIEASAQKRGGSVRFEALQEASASGGVAHESPEDVFERVWAWTVVDTAYRRLRDEAAGAGRQDQFRQLEPFLLEPPDADDYARISVLLGMRPNTLAVVVHRMRRRLRELVRLELLETTGEEADLARELRALRAGFARHLDRTAKRPDDAAPPEDAP